MQHRYTGTEDRELIDARGRRIAVATGDIADLPDHTAPQPELWEPVAPKTATAPTKTAKKGDN
jgi:hypothetical protein